MIRDVSDLIVGDVLSGEVSNKRIIITKKASAKVEYIYTLPHLPEWRPSWSSPSDPAWQRRTFLFNLADINEALMQ